MVTIQEVAARAGVSVGSVSRYLNGHQLKEQNMKKIKKAIDDLDYRENLFAKGLKSNQTLSIGVLMNNMQSVFSSTLIGQIEEEMDYHNYGILLNSYRNRPEMLEQKFDFLVDRHVDGLIAFEIENDWPVLARMENLEIPVISINTKLAYPNVDSIVVNNRESTKKIVKRIIQAGHQQIGIISAPQTASVAKDRLAGALEAVEEEGFPLENAEIYYGDYSQKTGYEGMRALIKRGIRTFFVTNYNMSLGALQYIFESGLKIGEDISFASYDYPGVSDIVYPQLTVVRQPVNQMGIMAVERMFERIRNPQLTGETFVLPNEILWRDSIKE
ncbi:LacI family DNA-binding transcriptional regulator [Enterococcus sp. HY326]|uniref:LacI family DNA-binding transcriptional regulator n=1 Tax=Enterococcus sp. HY326 TaxID=2971265 RepID=UPI0022401C04|nr:LacI family DNA-binding transcriptional regulator [Enterococcus sp. HY326]